MQDLKTELRLILGRRRGRQNAVTGKDLAAILGHRDDRKIRLAIRDLIGEGMPIASATEAPAGYFLVASQHEAERYADTIKNRLVQDAIRRRDFRRSASLYFQKATQGKLI